MTVDVGTTYRKRQNIVFHFVLPSLGPAAIVGLYFTPKSVFGCANRGLLALAIVCLTMVAAVATTVKGVKARKDGETEQSNWWLITTLILLLPTVLVIGPLG